MIASELQMHQASRHIMKRFLSPIPLVLVVVVALAPLLHAATEATKAEAVKDRSPAAPLATTLSTVTGIAISPLLGTGVYGAYQYFTTDTPEEKAGLPWYAQLGFFLPALGLVGVCAAKDALGAAVPPGLKKPLDVLETIENKATGLVAAGAVIPFSMSALSKLLVAQSGAPELMGSGFASIQLGVVDLSWLLNILTVPFGIAVFAVVWMASHAINVLILLSPWGAVDAVLKSARTALLGLLTLSATLNPWVGAALSLVVILIAYLVAGWSFRLTVFGSVFCWDFLTRRKRRFVPSETSNLVFSGGQLTKQGVPIRSYGWLAPEAGSGHWRFEYRSWLVGPVRSVVLTPEDAEIGRGLFFSTVRGPEGSLFILPPRYRDHEEALAKTYSIAGGVKEAGLLKAWACLRELFSGTATKVQAA